MDPVQRHRPRLFLRRPTALGLYAAAAALTGLAAVALSAHVSGLLLGLAIALLMLIAGAAALQFYTRSARRRTQWHSVMPCYLSIQDRDLRIIETNELFRRDFGDGRGHKCHDVYKSADEPCPDCPVLATFADGKIHTSRETVLTNDGREAQVVVTSAPQYDEHGEMVGVVEMSTNITELVQLQEELERTRTKYRKLFDLVPGYISVQDRDYNVIETNELCRRDFGEPDGRRCYTYYKKRDELCPGCIVRETFADGQVHHSEEIVETLDGRTVDLIVYSMPIHDRNGDVTQVMEVATDITEVKHLQSELTVIGRAVAGMAHRIKNILMGLEGGLFVVDTAMQGGDQERVAQGWEMVGRNVDRVSNIVKDLLYCSKRREASFQDDIVVDEIAREVHELFQERSASDGIELVLEAAAPTPRRLDPDGIHSLLTNLVTNAIDACRFDFDESKEDHRVVIRCTTTDTGTAIEVEDNGAGISDADTLRVFEDFFSTKGTEGTGLGLLIIHRVAEEHGGRVNYRTQVGKGTCFTVDLPVEPVPAQHSPATPAASEP